MQLVIFNLKSMLPATILAASVLFSSPVFAQGGDIPNQLPTTTVCPPLQETASLSLNWNIQATSPTEAKSKFDERLKEIEAFFVQAKVKKWTLENMSFSLNSNDYNTEVTNYQGNGSATYNVGDADQAVVLMEQLSKKKITSNINISAYRNGAC